MVWVNVHLTQHCIKMTLYDMWALYELLNVSYGKKVEDHKQNLKERSHCKCQKTRLSEGESWDRGLVYYRQWRAWKSRLGRWYVLTEAEPLRFLNRMTQYQKKSFSTITLLELVEKG